MSASGIDLYTWATPDGWKASCRLDEPSTLMGTAPGVLKLADSPLARANGLRHRSLGGKRGPGDSPLVKAAAAVGGGRRPVFTRDYHPATLGHRGRRSG